MERLDKILTNAMIGSRKEVGKKIREGAVCCDGVIVTNPAEKVDPVNQRITVDGSVLIYRKHYHIMLNKPRGYICATEDAREKTVLDLLPKEFPKQKLFPAGRLDKDTTGFVLLTTDGKLAHRITGPKNHVNKKYYVETDHPMEERFAQAFANGITIDDGYCCKGAIFEKLEEHACYLTLFEGKFHQVKRMFEALGRSVTHLQRVQIGSVCLDPALKEGEYRLLSEEECSLLEILPAKYSHIPQGESYENRRL